MQPGSGTARSARCHRSGVAGPQGREAGEAAHQASDAAPARPVADAVRAGGAGGLLGDADFSISVPTAEYISAPRSTGAVIYDEWVQQDPANPELALTKLRPAAATSPPPALLAAPSRSGPATRAGKRAQRGSPASISGSAGCPTEPPNERSSAPAKPPVAAGPAAGRRAPTWEIPFHVARSSHFSRFWLPFPNRWATITSWCFTSARVRGAVELHGADGLEVDAEQLPEVVALGPSGASPAPTRAGRDARR